MSGYLQFYGSSNVVSEVAERLNSAGSAYHHTEYWSDADAGEKSHSDKIQDALNSADERIATLESELAALKHDIERAVQRNSDLLAEVEGMRQQPSAISDERPGWVSVPMELLDRTVSALQRHIDRHGAMRIPVDMTDSDVVQAEINKLLAAAPKETK